MRAKSSTVSTSPRARWSTPAARHSSSALVGLPAQPASAALRVLRRWANAASTTAKTSVRAAVVEGGGELLGEPDVLVELPHGQEAGVAGQGCGRDLDLDRPRRREIE